MDQYIKTFDDITIGDVSEVGGKNASLGEMYTHLSSQGIMVPNGFAVTAAGYRYFLQFNKLDGLHAKLMESLDRRSFGNLQEVGVKARELILKGSMPGDLKDTIVNFYQQLVPDQTATVAVRSSATAEDLPEASFAGQHESYLNIKGADQLIEAVKKCFASMYTDRAIKYREDNGFDHSKVFLSVGVQLMVRADKACSGIGFTLEPESGFRNVVHLAGVWGLGENIVQGTVTPDEFILFKPTLKSGKKAILRKTLGSKLKMMVYAESASDKNATINLETPADMKARFVLADEEVTRLAKWALVIEEHYGKPMDIEWAKDGISGQLFIIQARPETVHSRKKTGQVIEYRLMGEGRVLVAGEAVGNKIATGPARILGSPEEAYKLKENDVLITDTISPDWDPILKKVSAIITNKGGRTSHASIVARELGVPAIVGCADATVRISDGQAVTVSCAGGDLGKVYAGELQWKELVHDFSSSRLPAATDVMLILGEPDRAFELSFYPNRGIGLMRLEFIITHAVQVHPMALVKFEALKDPEARKKIEQLTALYADKKQYFVDKLSQGVATIAAAFYPKPVIVRMSDFKTNEYANLVGGAQFEPLEENPMIGFRGASRYYNPMYKEGFSLECQALKLVRDDMGLDNVKLMIPFCRTPEEGRKVIEVMAQNGLRQGENGLEIYVMAEIPSNIILAEDFASIFDGFSIGSNDLTQLILGIDRDSSIIEYLFDEENPASTRMIRTMIEKAKLLNKKIGLCGQAPSDSPSFAAFLLENGIDSISFNPDALFPGIENLNKIMPALKPKPQAGMFEAGVRR